MPKGSSFCSTGLWSAQQVQVGLELGHLEVLCTAVSFVTFPAVKYVWPSLDNFRGRRAKLDSPAYCLAYLVSRCMCACCRHPAFEATIVWRMSTTPNVVSAEAGFP